MNSKIITALCCVIIFLNAVTLTAIGPLLPSITDAFSLSISQSGVLFTALYLGFISFVLIGGVLSDRFGKKLILTLSLSFTTLFLLLLPLSPNFYIACIIMFFIGGFTGILESMSSALAADVNPSNPGYYVNLVQIFFGIGAILGSVAVGLVLSLGIYWDNFYYILGVFSLGVTLAFGILKIPKVPKATKISLDSLKKLIKNRKFIIICLCMILYTGSEVGAWGWMSTLLEKTMNFSIMQASLSVAVFWASMTIGRIMCGYLISKFSLRKIIISLAFFSSIVTFIGVFTEKEIFVWMVIMLMGFGYSSMWPLIASYGSINTTAPSGTVFAVLAGGGGIGATLVPYLMGVFGELTTIGLAMLIPAGMLFAVGIFFIILGRERYAGRS